MSDLKNKIYYPIYFLSGEETYFIDKITDYIAKNVLTETEKAFNQMVMYGKDTTINDVDNNARRFPMMSNHQVVIIKEAQNLKKIEDIIYYAEKPLKSTILVLCYKYKTLDKRKKVYKVLEKSGVLFESPKLYDNKIPAWIVEYLKERNYTIDPVACRLINDFLGNDLSKIANELDKLAITIKPGTQINSQDIETNIGISKDYNTFELQNALTEKDFLKANRIVNYFKQNSKEHPIALTITSLYFFYVKILRYHYLKDKSPRNAAAVLQINPYFIKDYENAAKKYNAAKTVNIISYLREYDMKSKGYGNVSATEGELLTELIFKILH